MNTDITDLILTMKLKEATKNPYLYVGSVFMSMFLFLVISVIKGWV